MKGNVRDGTALAFSPALTVQLSDHQHIIHRRAAGCCAYLKISNPHVPIRIWHWASCQYMYVLMACVQYLLNETPGACTCPTCIGWASPITDIACMHQACIDRNEQLQVSDHIIWKKLNVMCMNRWHLVSQWSIAWNSLGWWYLHSDCRCLATRFATDGCSSVSELV